MTTDDKEQRPERARLDADGTAKPKTELAAVVTAAAVAGQRVLHDNQIESYIARPTGEAVATEPPGYPITREMPNAGPATVRCFACASNMPEAACSHWVGIGWSCTDRKACRARRATPAEPPTPKQALDGLFNGAVAGLGGVHAARLFNIVRADLDAKYSRDEHVAALEALEVSTRMTTIHECAQWLEESEDLDLVAGRMSKAMRSAK